MRKLKNYLTISLSIETLLYFFGYVYVRQWSIKHHMYLFLQRFQDCLFYELFLSILLLSLVYYDTKYTKRMKFVEGYIISFLLFPVNAYYTVEFGFLYQSYLQNQINVWKKYLNYPILKDLQAELNCCGFNKPYDIRSTVCQDSFNGGCYAKILEKFGKNIFHFSLLTVFLIALNITHIYFGFRLTYRRNPK